MVIALTPDGVLLSNAKSVPTGAMSRELFSQSVVLHKEKEPI